MRAGAGDAGIGQDPAQGGSGHRNLFALVQQFGQVLLVDPGVSAPRQRHDPAPLALLDPTFRLPPPVSVSQRFGSFRPVSGQHPPDVSLTPTQQLGGV